MSGLYLSLGEAWYPRLAPKDLSPRTLSRHAEDIIQDLLKFMGSGVYSTLRKVP